jgi:hypothetical protein
LCRQIPGADFSLLDLTFVVTAAATLRLAVSLRLAGLGCFICARITYPPIL